MIVLRELTVGILGGILLSVAIIALVNHLHRRAMRRPARPPRPLGRVARFLLGVRSPTEDLRKGYDPEAFARGAAEVAPGVEAWRRAKLERAARERALCEDEAVAGPLRGDDPELYPPEERERWRHKGW